MPTLFISDLHLSNERPDISERFAAFCDSIGGGVEALYILGDLYEYWIGDDAADVLGYANSIAQLARLSDRGIRVYFMHGNRDFLIGNEFAERTGCSLLTDPYTIELYGRQVLLTHGDSLCTDDIAHQDWRRTYLDPAWRAAILAKSISERHAKAREIRALSVANYAAKSDAIMDVNNTSVIDMLTKAEQRSGATMMIHGHTHRPAVHRHPLPSNTVTTMQSDASENAATRIVLGDWYTQTSCLWVDAERMELTPGELIVEQW